MALSRVCRLTAWVDECVLMRQPLLLMSDDIHRHHRCNRCDHHHRSGSVAIQCVSVNKHTPHSSTITTHSLCVWPSTCHAVCVSQCAVQHHQQQHHQRHQQPNENALTHPQRTQRCYQGNALERNAPTSTLTWRHDTRLHCECRSAAASSCRWWSQCAPSRSRR